MATFLTSWALILRRSVAHWRLLSAVVLGVVLAVAIASSTVLYFQALRGLGLARDLDAIPPNARTVELRMEINSPSLEDYAEARGTVASVAEQTMQWLVAGEVRSGRSSTFYARRSGERFPPLDERMRGSFQFVSDPEALVEVVEGRIPQPASALNGDPPVLEGAIGEAASALSGVTVGDTLVFAPFWEDETEDVRVQVVGKFRPVSGYDEVWETGVLRLTRQLSIRNTVPLLVPEETYFRGMAPLFPKANTTAGWTLYADVNRLKPWNAPWAKAGLAILRNSLGGRYQNFKMDTPLENVLADFQIKLFFMQVPLLVVTLMLVIVVLYYTVLLASLLVERQRGEIALLRNRGASSRQIVLVYAMEGLVLSAIALLLGPPVAAGAVALLGLTPAFASLSGGGLLPVHLSVQAFQMGLLGAVLTQGALLLPAFSAARSSVVTHKQQLTRPAQRPFLQRSYLDLGLLGVTALLLWQLESQRSLVVLKGTFDEPTLDQLLLLVPALFLLAAALLFLRLFPLVLAGLGRLIGGVAPVWFTLGLWELSRNPAHYGRLVLLLMMAAGLGVFAASFGGTLDRSYRERALYEAGGDIRVSGISLGPLKVDMPIAESYRALPGVETASPAIRGSGTILSELFEGSYRLLAVEPESFVRASWFRDDFSRDSFRELMDFLSEEAPEIGIPLPAESRDFSLWVRPLSVDPTTTLWAQMRDSNGRYFLYRLGELDFDEWRRIDVFLSEPSPQRLPRGQRVTIRPTGLVRLTSIFAIQGRRQGGQAAGTVLLDDLQAGIGRGETIPLEDFEGEMGWGPLRASSGAARDRVDTSPFTPTGRGSSASLTWEAGQVVMVRGLAPGLDRTPLPAVASLSFLNRTGHRIGDEVRVTLSGQQIVARVKGVVDFFPTLDPQTEQFLVAPIAPVLARVNLTSPFSEIQPNELWLATTPEADRAAMTSLLRSNPFSANAVVDRAALLAGAQADPLVAAGWGALLLIAYISVLLLSVIGFIVHAYVSAQERRLVFAAMRSLGLSVPQLVGVVWFEQALIIGLGLAFGTWMGDRIGALLLPFLGHTEEGGRVLPPFIIETNWSAVGWTYAAMGLIFLLTVGLIIWVFSRLALFRALRVGEV